MKNIDMKSAKLETLSYDKATAQVSSDANFDRKDGIFRQLLNNTKAVAEAMKLLLLHAFVLLVVGALFVFLTVGIVYSIKKMAYTSNKQEVSYGESR
jgi:hypothetical protein